jgi:hypothetical protein
MVDGILILIKDAFTANDKKKSMTCVVTAFDL